MSYGSGAHKDELLIADGDGEPGAASTDVIGDYVADEQAYNERNLRLNELFVELRASAKSAAGHMLAANLEFYVHVVKLMLFWHEAKDTNYIDNLVKSKTDRVYKETVSHGVNFAPLIDVVWMGIDCKDLPTNKSNRISRALNRLYEVFGREFGYDPASEEQLVQYIVDKGGINGLVSYRTDDLDPANENAPDYKVEKDALRKSSEIAKMATQMAYKDSLDYFRSKEDLNAFHTPFEIAVNDDHVSLVLVNKKGDSQYAVIDTVFDKAPISRVLTRSYLGQYGYLPTAVRCIVETLATQCCPAEHEGTWVNLLNEVGRTKSTDGKTRVRRLVYRHHLGDMLLSNVRGDGGLVTIVSPKVNVLRDAIDDVCLTALSRRHLETYLISPKNFRLLSFSRGISDAGIPSSGQDFTHSMKIDVLLAKDGGGSATIPLYFHRERLDRQPQLQVDVVDQKTAVAQWERKVNPDWFKRFNAAFTNSWVNSHARHLNRQHQSVLELVFQHSSLTINFFNLDNECDLHTVVAAPSGNAAYGQRRSFVSRDLAVAMLQIAELPITGEVSIALYPSYLRISYETEVGEYKVYVPAVDSVGNQLPGGFGHYTMQSIIPNEPDDSNAVDDEGEL